MLLPPFTALQERVEALATAQRAKTWTTPQQNKQLDETEDAIATLAATFSLTASVEADASAEAAADAAANALGGAGGQATDALSLGVGVSAAAAAKISAGLSLGVSFSASFDASLVVSLHAAISAVATLELELNAYNETTAALTTSAGILPPYAKPNADGVNKAFRGLSTKLADTQRRASAQAPAKPVEPITAEVRMYRLGAWHAEIATDDEKPLFGKVSFESDGIVFTGTIVPENSGIDGSRARCKVVGGNGRLSSDINAHSYTSGGGVTVKTIVIDILQDCGESLSDLADGATLDKKLARWHTASGPASHALTKLADEVGAAWRVMRDGTVWFGTETWPEVAPAGTLVDEDWSAGRLTLAPDKPNLIPGVVYQGQRIDHVTHRLGTTLRTDAEISTGESVADKFLAGVRRDIDYSRSYPCKVVTQNPDGTLQLLPDDAKMKARGLDKVQILCGLPGFRVKVKNGARCEMHFAAGDPTRPRVMGWELDEGSVESVEMVAGGRSAPLARLGDPIKVFVAPAVPILLTGTVIISGSPAPLGPGTFMTITTALVGAIDGGNPLLKG